MNKQILYVHVNDSKIIEQWNNFWKKLLVWELIEPTKNNVQRIVSNLWLNWSKDVANINIPENKLLKRALEILQHSTNPRRKNPSMIWEFNWVNYSNARLLLQAAQEYLSHSYWSEFRLSWWLSWSVRNDWDIISTRYWDFTHWKWNRRETDKLWKIENVKKWFRIWDSVTDDNGKIATVIDASHEHDWLRKWTARILIKYKNWKTRKEVPWLIKKIDK